MSNDCREEVKLNNNSNNDDNYKNVTDETIKSKQYKELNGLLISFKDDKLNESVKLALKRKTRVRYKCMDTYSNFLAFGTSGGAIYLFKLKSINHSTCSLISMIPCDQGCIEVIKFLPNPQTDNLLIVIGTKRGSIVIFKLSQVINNAVSNLSISEDLQQQQINLNQQHQPICIEIYRAEGFTNNNGIKLIEYDQDLFDSTYSFSKLYICDSTNRLYVLDSTTIYAFKQSLRLFYSNHLPSLIFSVNDSEINQINVHRSHLLISTNETTRLFNEQTNQLYMIGTQKRRQGFYGACFFNSNYKPFRILNVGKLSNHQQHQHQHHHHHQQQQQQQQQNGNINQQTQIASSQQTIYSSTTSINDLENLLIFVARPSFRLWQVNYERKVKLTHQFESLIKCSPFSGKLIELTNEPINIEKEQKEKSKEEIENSNSIIEKFKIYDDDNNKHLNSNIRSDHFQKLIPIYSSTLGNLLLSYTKHELFVVDPVGAKLIAWHSFKNETIIQVCSNENELFIWCKCDNYLNTTNNDDFKLERLVLLAPTQFVLDLHRLHRYWTIILFVQLFSDLFRHRMALPLDGNSIITTEGGLLRNVLLNAWDIYVTKYSKNSLNHDDVTNINNQIGKDDDDDDECKEFKKIVNEIIEESRQLKQSLDNLTDSRFFLTMTNENIDRLCSEPYASLVSLEVSIADLHSNHVIHFSKDALNRHKSVANLSRNISSISKLNENSTKSNFDLTNNLSQTAINGQESNNGLKKNNNESNNKVLVERLIPSKKSQINNRNNNNNKAVLNENHMNNNQIISNDDHNLENRFMNKIDEPFFSIKASKEPARFNEDNDNFESIETNSGTSTFDTKSKLINDNCENQADSINNENNQNLVNENILINKVDQLFLDDDNQLSMRRDADVKEVVNQLLKYPELLNNCKLNSSFYLNAISTLIANQSPLNRKRLDQYKDKSKNLLLS